MLGKSDSGLYDAIPHKMLKQVVDILEDSDDDWIGPGESLYISLGDKKWVAKNNDPDGEVDYEDEDFSESWTVILNVPRSYKGGPGFKIEVIDLDNMKEYFLSDEFNAESYGVEDREVFWEDEGIVTKLMYYIQDSDDLFVPDHYWDKPFSAEDLAGTLCDIYEFDLEEYV